MKAARAAKAGASSTPAADPNPSSTLPLPPPTTTEALLGSSSPSPHSPQALPTPGSPPPIAAVPLAVAQSPAPTPLDKGKRVLEIISDDEDSDGGLVFKRRKAVRTPTLPAASPQGGNSFRDNPPSATSLPPTMVQEETGEGAESAPPPSPAEVSVREG
ncbi:classical arabinogalactan protein 9-like [Phaseolus vulgaris]|uniref:classical arabinogalactan protein 9-like n=1 Tax=Phaseolus vulgaris TaxID=3885 RepID=UPI0035CBAB0C